MKLLVLLLVLSLVSLSYSSVVNTTLQRQLYNFNLQTEILHDLLAKECPGYLQEKRDVPDLQNQQLEILTAQVQRLNQKLLKCQTGKLQPTSASINVTETVVTSTPPQSTNPISFCSSSDGQSILNVRFISYSNPTNKEGTGIWCYPDRSPCHVFMEICISSIRSSNCELYHHVTDVIGDKSKINLLDNPGNLTNPVKIYLGDKKWQGANVHITVLARNPANSWRVYHEVDEFSYDLTDVQGSPHRLLTLHGQRAVDETELVVMFTIPCPSPLTTLPTTPLTTLPTTPLTTLPTTPLTTSPTTTSTALPTTTASLPTPAECLTATNLTESWRLDHNGTHIKAGGPHSYEGYACDLVDRGWFRFSGAAGTHMLDRCPKDYSCGTASPDWTDETPPKAVGVATNMTAYGVNSGHCKDLIVPMQVMRCSWTSSHDLIYKYVGQYATGFQKCLQAFCGMN